jgi:hypothetical protein
VEDMTYQKSRMDGNFSSKRWMKKWKPWMKNPTSKLWMKTFYTVHPSNGMVAQVVIIIVVLANE